VAVVRLAKLLPGDTEWLAWVSSANKLDWADFIGVKVSDVAVDGHSRPVLCEDSLAIGVDFAEGDCPHSSSFESKAESADAGKEVKNPHLSTRVEVERI
jgi:hypothetical protein